MSADIIEFAKHGAPPDPKNGAREALIEIGKNCPFHIRDEIAAYWADDLLTHLAAAGFVIIPVS
jgi:hypothetical protein